MAAKQVVLITGANTGLGLEVVKALYKSPSAYDIVLGCRTTSKGEEAAKSVQQETPDSASTIAIQQIDIASDESIQKAVDATSSKYGKLDVLINNAGASPHTSNLPISVDARLTLTYSKAATSTSKQQPAA